ncbi:hypothetical protein DYB32_006535 [Aphanomyces invadans]|nr:hypothetical protein DYB32_006535 [Aphanomyces invadans]
MQSGYETHTVKTSAGFGGSKRSGLTGHSDRTSPFAAKYQFDHEDTMDEGRGEHRRPHWQDDASKSDLERQEEKMREKVAELYDVLKDKAASARDAVMETASDVKDSLKERAKVVKDKVDDVDKRHVETESEMSEEQDARQKYPC